jgi:hypothetical protein
MRRIALPAALLLVLTAATPALANAGLPKIASLQVGSHVVAVHGDSPSLHTGTNTLTVEIADLTPDHTVTLSLKGPSGQSVAVPLEDLVILSGPDEHSHGEADMSGMDMGGMNMGGMDMPGMSHDSGTSGHDMSAMSHDSGSAEGFNARGKVSLNATGTWHVVVEVAGHDQKQSAEAHADVVDNGPNRVYLGFTGFLMGGTFLYGIVERRRQHVGR